MWSYILEVHICWLLFYAFYALSISKETYFFVNRWYLLTTFFLGLILPFVKISQGITNEVSEIATYLLPVFEVGRAADASDLLSANQIWLLFWAGALLYATLVFLGLSRLYALYARGTLQQQQGYTLVLVDEDIAPFSFFSLVFVSRAQIQHAEDWSSILKHELIHVKSWHSADKLFITVLGIFFWYSPLFWLFRKSLHDVHEFEADAGTVRSGNLLSYGALLLKFADRKRPVTKALANPFITSQLKRRFKMLAKKPSNHTSLIKYLLAVPILMLSIFVLSCKDNIDFSSSDNLEEKDILYVPGEATPPSDIPPPPPPAPPKGPVKLDDTFNGEKVFQRVEQMPQYGSGDMDLINFLAANIKYPADAREAGIEGTVVAQFIVSTDGKAKDVEIVRGIGGGCDEEAKRVVELLDNWKPGIQDGKAVPVKFTLPIRFKLE